MSKKGNSLMATQRRALLLGLLGIFLGFPAPLLAANREYETLEASGEVLDALVSIPARGIPPALLKDAKGVAIFPGVLKAGLVIGGRFGRGVLASRDINGCWSRPIFVTITGGGLGWQVGVQSTDLVLIFKTRTSLDKILKCKGKITLGADIAIAAGPIGRQAEAATDAQLRAEILSYSRSRGLFVGLSVEGAAMMLDASATDAYYRTPPPPPVIDPRTGTMVAAIPPEDRLLARLASLTGSPVPPVVPGPPLVPMPAPQPPPHP
jgi:lipid-binding SYLF domain-containing protein